MPDYTKDQLSDWLYEYTDFIQVYREWVRGKYQKDMKPSVDRLDDSLPYTMDNIQLVAWIDNFGKLKKPVVLDGIEYESMNQCTRETGHCYAYIKKRGCLVVV